MTDLIPVGPGPSPEAYEAAAEAYLREGFGARTTGHRRAVQRFASTDPALRASVDAVWPLAVAAGRAQAAAAIRAENDRREAIFGDNGYRLAFDEAAKIAEGGQGQNT